MRIFGAAEDEGDRLLTAEKFDRMIDRVWIVIKVQGMSFRDSIQDRQGASRAGQKAYRLEQSGFCGQTAEGTGNSYVCLHEGLLWTRHRTIELRFHRSIQKPISGTGPFDSILYRYLKPWPY